MEELRTRNNGRLPTHHADLFTPPNDLLPCVLVVLFHDAGDDDTARELLLELLQLLKHYLKWTVRDKLNVLPANHVAGIWSTHPSVSGRHVDDLGGIKAQLQIEVVDVRRRK